MNKTRILAIVSLAAILTVIIGVFVATCEDKTEVINIAWDPIPEAEGYRVYVSTYYDRQDLSLHTVKDYDAKNATAMSLTVPKTSDWIDTAVVNVCFSVAAYTYDYVGGQKMEKLGELSEAVCTRPWPPKNFKIKD